MEAILEDISERLGECGISFHITPSKEIEGKYYIELIETKIDLAEINRNEYALLGVIFHVVKNYFPTYKLNYMLIDKSRVSIYPIKED